jgi:hypothetical protein
MTILSRADLIDLSGYRRPGPMGNWLRQNGFVFVVAGDGWPRVDQEHYLARMGKVASKTFTGSPPNFNALRETQRKRT